MPPCVPWVGGYPPYMPPRVPWVGVPSRTHGVHTQHMHLPRHLTGWGDDSFDRYLNGERPHGEKGSKRGEKERL